MEAKNEFLVHGDTVLIFLRLQSYPRGTRSHRRFSLCATICNVKELWQNEFHPTTIELIPLAPTSQSPQHSQTASVTSRRKTRTPAGRTLLGEASSARCLRTSRSSPAGVAVGQAKFRHHGKSVFVGVFKDKHQAAEAAEAKLEELISKEDGHAAS